MALLRELDSLVIDVLIDNHSDSLSSRPSHVSSETSNAVAAGATELSGENLCCAQLGLSLMLTAQTGSERHKLLFDAGPEGPIFLRNCRNLGVALGDVEMVAVSHGHWDHMGALPAALSEITRGGRKVPCHVNPGMFRERASRLRGGAIVPYQKVPSAEVLSACGAEVVNAYEGRSLLDGLFYLSGEIPRVSGFEKGRPDHLWRPSPESAWEPDPLIMDERYLVAAVRGKGLIVMTSCSHAGVVNVLHNVRQNFPADPIYGLIGGLHLVGEAIERIIPQTVDNLRAFGLRQIMPAHCTGWRALHALLNAFGEGIVTPSAVGNRVSF